ncbi:MAG: glutathione S-transferase [Pseudomonadota bacterium]
MGILPAVERRKCMVRVRRADGRAPVRERSEEGRAAMAYELVIGNFNTSSWSLRSWVLMHQFGFAFDEVFVRLTDAQNRYVEGRAAEVGRHSPSGTVPVLRIDGAPVWDTLAIAETLAERHADLDMWPSVPQARAHARAVSAEMHAGFTPLRAEHPMDISHYRPVNAVSDAVASNIRRIVALWGECRSRFAGDGEFLFGAFSIADSMYAPVVSRFATYGIDPRAYGGDEKTLAYMQAVWAVPAMVAFRERAVAEIGAQRADAFPDWIA